MEVSQGVRLDLSPKEVRALNLARLNRRLKLKRVSPRSQKLLEEANRDRLDTDSKQANGWRIDEHSIQQAKPNNTAGHHVKEDPVSPGYVMSWQSPPQTPFTKWRKPLGVEEEAASFSRACCSPCCCRGAVLHTDRQLLPAGYEHQPNSPSPQSTLDGFRPYHQRGHSTASLYPRPPSLTTHYFSHPGMPWPRALRRTLSVQAAQVATTCSKSPKAFEAPYPLYKDCAPTSHQSNRPLAPWGPCNEPETGSCRRQPAHTLPQDQASHPRISVGGLSRTFPHRQTALQFLSLTPGREPAQRGPFQGRGAFKRLSEDAPQSAPHNPPLSTERPFHARGRSWREEQFRGPPQAASSSAHHEGAPHVTRIEVLQAEAPIVSTSSDSSSGEGRVRFLPRVQLPKALSASTPPSLIGALRVYYNSKVGKPPASPAPEGLVSLSSTYPINRGKSTDPRGRLLSRGDSGGLSFGPPSTPRTSPSPRTQSWLRSTTGGSEELQKRAGRDNGQKSGSSGWSSQASTKVMGSDKPKST